MGCGYEPEPPAGFPVKPWDHESRIEANEPPPTVCPGYTCGLPEVIEASHARLHWSKGALKLYAKKPTPQLLSAITILEREINRVQDWAMEHPEKDG